jgi:parvulin-like peptidyl-prolyl isomerase
MPKPRNSARRAANQQATARQKQSRKEIAAAVKTAELQKKKAAKRTRLFTISAIVGVVALVAVFFVYLTVIMPYQQVILTVGQDNVKTGYFLRRLVANPSGDISSTLQGLTAELLVKQQAPTMGVTPVTAQDINEYLRAGAAKAKGTDTISDADYDAWFREQLANRGLPAKEYREIAARDILRTRLQDIVAANIKSIAPQVHLWAIVVASNDAAVQAKAKIDGGEDFAAVAANVSLDSTATTSGGDQGWVPPDVLDSQLSTQAATLDVGKCSDPITYTQQSSTSSTGTVTNYVLLFVSEKSDAMEMTTDQLTVLKNKALLNWLNEQSANTTVTYHGLNGSTTLDAQTTSWLQLQAQKLTSRLSTTEQTVTQPTTTEPTTAPTTTEPTTTAPTTTTSP